MKNSLSSKHSNDLNAGCLVAAFFTQIPIIQKWRRQIFKFSSFRDFLFFLTIISSFTFAFTSYTVIWIGLEIRRQIKFLEKAVELVQVPVTLQIFGGIYFSSLVFSLIILISTWASNHKDQFSEVLETPDSGNFLCWFGGVTWWIAYRVYFLKCRILG